MGGIHQLCPAKMKKKINECKNLHKNMKKKSREGNWVRENQRREERRDRTSYHTQISIALWGIFNHWSKENQKWELEMRFPCEYAKKTKEGLLKCQAAALNVCHFHVILPNHLLKPALSVSERFLSVNYLSLDDDDFVRRICSATEENWRQQR